MILGLQVYVSGNGMDPKMAVVSQSTSFAGSGVCSAEGGIK